MPAGTQRRLTREEARLQTRERLLAAGGELFARRGFHATTLDQVADAAGYTKGAVYSAFASKADLFLTIFEARTRERVAGVQRMGARASSLAEVQRLGQGQWVGMLSDRRELSLLLVEFEVYAARDEELRQRLAEIKALYRRAVCAALEQVLARSGEEVSLSPEYLTIAVLALGNGILLEDFSNPGPENVKIFEAASDLLLRGLREGQEGQ